MSEQEIARLKQRLAEAEKALEWYADSWNYGDGNGFSWEHCEFKLIGEDRGKRAREYFAKWKNKRTSAESEK